MCIQHILCAFYVSDIFSMLSTSPKYLLCFLHFRHIFYDRYGEVVNLNLVRDKKTGKSKGYGFLCYEDQRSTILAVDNFNSSKVYCSFLLIYFYIRLFLGVFNILFFNFCSLKISKGM